MLTKEINEEFIGRDEELGVFKQWLTNFYSEPILFIYDETTDKSRQGGIGKTWLLHRYYALAQEHRHNVVPPIIDFFNVSDRDGVVIAGHIVDALQAKIPQWTPTLFTAALHDYDNAVSSGSTRIADSRIRLGEALTEDLQHLHDDMNGSIILFFDTFELIEYNPISAVLFAHQRFPDTYQFDRIRAVVAGRNAPDWSQPNWIGRENEVRLIPLSPFNYDETIRYLNVNSNASDISNQSHQTLDALYKQTEGRPILVGLLTDVLNRQRKSLDTLVFKSKSSFEESLAERINDFDYQIKWATLFMSHMYHRFGAPTLNLIMKRPELRKLVGDMKYGELYSTLATLSFVRHSSSSEDFILHDEMRRLVNTYSWPKEDPDRRIRLQLSEIAITYYESLLAEENDQEKRQSYIVEKMFHLFFINTIDGFGLFQEQFTRALNLSLRAFARALLQEVQRLAEQHQLSSRQQRDLIVAEAKLLLTEENPSDALKRYETLEHVPDFPEREYTDILFGMANCYVQMSEFENALSYYLECLKREESNVDRSFYASILNRLGYISRRQGLNAKARAYYEESLKILKELDDRQQYATVLNNLANVYRLQGNLEDALRACKRSLQIRRQLFKENKGSEADIALSLSLLGHIYHTLKDIAQEERYYEDAYEIYNRLGDKRGIAAASNSLGRICFDKGDLEGALVYYTQGSQFAKGVDREAEIESFNELGRISIKQGKWKDAISHLEYAVQLSRQTEQYFSIAENLLYIAEAYDQLDIPSNHIREDARKIAKSLDNKFLLGRIEEIQGNEFFRVHEYQTAFSHYREACRYMALYGKIEFEQILRRLEDVLLETPRDLLPGIIDSLVEYWFGLNMDEPYPQFPRMCKAILNL